MAAATLWAQQKPAVFKSNIELVHVDVVVVDNDGNAVRGLPQSAFTLIDRKKLQTVSTFEEISHERAQHAASAPVFPASLKMDVASNTTVQADRLVMVVVDDLHIWKGRTDKAKELTRDIIVKLGGQASMALLFTSGEHSTQVTQDRSQLLAAVDTLQGRQTFRRPHQAVDDQKASFNPGAFSRADDALLKTMDNLSEAQKVNLQDFGENLQSFQTLQDAAKMLRVEDQRRKAFVLISEGMQLEMTGIFENPQSMSDMASLFNAPNADYSVGLNKEGYHADALRTMMESLRRSNVATYAIDPRGKVRPEDMSLELFPGPPGGFGGDDSAFRWENPIRMAQDNLGVLAEASGGFAVTDTDDLTGGLNRIIEDIDHYYLLGFYPSDTSGGDKYRPISVAVKDHPDYTVRFRRGYMPGAPPPDTSNKDPLVALAAGVMPKGDLPLRLTAMPLVGKGKNANVAIALEVTTPTGVMKDVDNKLRDDVSYSVLVVDDKKSKVTQRTGRAASFSLSAKDASAVMPDTVTYQIPLTIDLPPGQYQLRASATSKKLGKGGSVYIDVTVPDCSKESLVLSGIALAYADGARVPVGRTPTVAGPTTSARTSAIPVGPGAISAMDKLGAAGGVPVAAGEERRLPFDPSLSREFLATDTIRAYFEVARKDLKSTVALTVMILGAGNTPMMAIDKTVGPNDPGKVDFRIPLAPLGPGAFILRIAATDSHTVAKTETGIVVK